MEFGKGFGHYYSGWDDLCKEYPQEDRETYPALFSLPENCYEVKVDKPMGIAFVENNGETGGVYVDEVLAEGSAASCGTKLEKGDQLVGVDATPVVGADFDAALDAIKASTTDSTKLTFFRGPIAFLYGLPQVSRFRCRVSATCRAPRIWSRRQSSPSALPVETASSRSTRSVSLVRTRRAPACRGTRA